MGGCDKTTPALVMGALSMNLPSIFVPAGPMLRGDYRGEFLGSGSDVWKYWAELRAGTITEDDWREIEDGIARSPGHCMTMGTASTMTSAAEAMGLTLPGAASIPAPDSRHAQMATQSGRRIVDMVWEDLAIRDVVDARAIHNAVTTVLALGGSTNAVVHLIAVARRARVPLDLDVIRTRETPLVADSGLAVLRGNLAPDGAVIKPPAMEPQLARHRGPAVVFRDYNDMAARIDDPDLPVTRDSVLVLQSAGPQGAPGLPEWGQLPLPKKLLQQGVRDMVRISDARMSGTSYGACVLHVSPESHVGGPLALVRDGDIVALDVPGRTLTLEVDATELARRKASWVPPKAHYTRGFGTLYLKHVTQAHEGCDFDFLEEGSADTADPEIH